MWKGVSLIPTPTASRPSETPDAQQSSHGDFKGREPIRILVISHSSLLNGAQLSLLDLLSNLDRDRFQPIVVAANEGPLNAKLRDIRITEPATLTRIMLKHAFLAYKPAETLLPVTLIANNNLNDDLADPSFPLNRLIPNRNIIVSGENHIDAVSSEQSARMIQKIIDGETAA